MTEIKFARIKYIALATIASVQITLITMDGVLVADRRRRKIFHKI